MKPIQPIRTFGEYEASVERERLRCDEALRAFKLRETEPRLWRALRWCWNFLRGRNLSHSQHLARLGLAVLFWAIMIPLVVILVMSL